MEEPFQKALKAAIEAAAENMSNDSVLQAARNALKLSQNSVNSDAVAISVALASASPTNGNQNGNDNVNAANESNQNNANAARAAAARARLPTIFENNENNSNNNAAAAPAAVNEAAAAPAAVNDAPREFNSAQVNKQFIIPKTINGKKQKLNFLRQRLGDIRQAFRSNKNITSTSTKQRNIYRRQINSILAANSTLRGGTRKAKARGTRHH